VILSRKNLWNKTASGRGCGQDYICTELSQSEAENLKLNGEIKALNTLNTDLNEKNKTRNSNIQV
jgi:hypothetical protein